jgi:hypothetical protein
VCGVGVGTCVGAVGREPVRSICRRRSVCRIGALPDVRASASIHGFTDAGVSSAPLRRQRYRGTRGPQVAMQPIRTYDLWFVCAVSHELLSYGSASGRCARGCVACRATGLVLIQTVGYEYMIYSTQTQIATTQDLPGPHAGRMSLLDPLHCRRSTRAEGNAWTAVIRSGGAGEGNAPYSRERGGRHRPVVANPTTYLTGGRRLLATLFSRSLVSSPHTKNR